MSRKLLIATRNAGKFPEIAALLDGAGFDIINLNDVPEIPKGYEVEEPAMTFEGNAIIKAVTYGRKSGILTAAEDAGIEVDALDGRPGIYSARFAPGTDKDRYEKLLKELEGVPMEKRTARFKAVVAVYDPETDKIRTTLGVSEGHVTLEPRGGNGFGYDPVFLYAELNKAGGELTLEEKNSVSHRGKAFRAVRKLLDKFTSGN